LIAFGYIVFCFQHSQEARVVQLYANEQFLHERVNVIRHVGGAKSKSTLGLLNSILPKSAYDALKVVNRDLHL